MADQYSDRNYVSPEALTARARILYDRIRFMRTDNEIAKAIQDEHPGVVARIHEFAYMDGADTVVELCSEEMRDQYNSR